jgi:hypothetical protein
VRRNDFAGVPSSCRISGTAMPTRPPSSRYSTSTQPGVSRMSGLSTSTASYGSAAAMPALMPAE